MAPFSYYDRLARGEQAIYRKSDRVIEVRLPDPRRHREAVARVAAALESGKRQEVERAARALVDGIALALEIEPVDVSVLSKRPRSRESELHGLYTREPGETALIQVWMRTAGHRRVVAFRTFLRTLIHEVCHHLDYALYEWDESFHTEGFFRRESSLVRQLAPREGKDAERNRASPSARPSEPSPRKMAAHAPVKQTSFQW